MKGKRLLALFILLLTPGESFAQASDRETLENKLQRSIATYSVSEGTFLQALTKVAAEFEIPMGIEWLRDSRAAQPIQLTFGRVLVSNIIQAIVSAQPGYDWNAQDGMVHVFPRHVRRSARNFLNIPIDKFEVQNDYVAFASARFREQLMGRMASHRREGVTPEGGTGSAGSMATGQGDRRVSFRLQNVTVRGVLDQFGMSADFKV